MLRVHLHVIGALLLSSSCTAFGQGESSGEGAVVVVVRADEEAAAIASQTANAVRAELELAGYEVREPTASRPDATVSGDVDRAAEAYENLDPASARDIIEGVIERVEREGCAGLDRERFLRALLILALASSAAGDQVTADAALDRALGVEPALTLDPALYSPALRAQLRERRSELEGRPEGGITVAGPHREATFSLDCGAPRAVGEVDVRPGRHILILDAPGRRLRTVAVDVSAGEQVRVEGELDADPQEILRHPGRLGESPEPLVEAAREMASGLLLIELEVEEGAFNATAFASETGRSSSVTGSTSVEPETVVRALLAGLEESPGDAEAGDADLVSTDAAQRRRRRGWLIGGVTAATIVVGVVVGLLVAAPWEPEAPTSFDIDWELK